LQHRSKVVEVIELCRKYIAEAVDSLKRGDVVQSSEKLYKVVEEAVKILAEVHNLDAYRKSVEVGRWSVQRLEEAAKQLAAIYGDAVYDAWKIAYERLHIEGFHERRLTPEDVASEIDKVIYLVSLLESLVM